MRKNIENQISHDALILAQDLINLYKLNQLEYHDAVKLLKKDLGIKFYDKYLAWHEKELNT